VREGAGPRFTWLPVSVGAYGNSSFPWGYNDGAIWQGRGLTAAVKAGLAAQWGPLSLHLEPLAFWAQNVAFELQPNGFSDSLRFADGRFPLTIDAPQRFGDRPYWRLDPGQSTLRLDLPVATAGISSANQWWGPAAEQPAILGNNAPGFRHAFLGTSRPLDLWLAKVHGRVVWGDLRQSQFTRNLPPADRRFMSGLVGVLEPRGLDGLEIGGSRFIHDTWPQDGLSLSSLAKPFGALLRSQRPVGSDPANPGSDPDNGLASIWARWNVPAGGVEIYGEYAKEDDNWDLRDLASEPENSGGYVLGLRKVWGLSGAGFWGVEIERLDLRPSQYIIGRSGGQFYVHSRQRQGHTAIGQILGAPFGEGGFASIVALERYHRLGRWRVSWTRALRQDFQRLATDPSDPFRRVRRVAALDPRGYDMVQALGIEALRFRGPLTMSGGVTAIYDFNRNFAGDRANLNVWVGLAWHPGQEAAKVPPGAVDPLGAGPNTKGAPALRHTGPVFSYPEGGLGSLSDVRAERRRLDQILGSAASHGFLLRSASSWLAPIPGPANKLRAAILGPEVAWVHNSRLPFSLNDGPLWAGVGSNVLVTLGFRSAWGPVSLVLAPQLAASANQPFPLPDPKFRPLPLPAGRDSLSSPWYIRPASIDLPLRFGTRPFERLYPGQSTLQVAAGPVAFGVSTENHWWGPGLRNAIVLSDNAPGFRHLFLRTARPVTTALGVFEGKWLAAGLEESGYFDRDPSNNLRSLSALAVTWQPRWVPDLTLGVARAVYAPATGWTDIPVAFFDALWSDPGRPNDRPLADSSQVPGSDQIYSWFGRWLFPQAGFEFYGEFSKTEFPASFRDLLVTPGHTLGYTLGLEWVKPLGDGRRGRGVVRLQAEHTFLEKSSTFRQRPVGTYYTSRAVLQGYTNDGQVLGAAIGPGASSHWLALDYVTPRWQVGVFGSRIRWNNDALYSVPLPNPYIAYWCMHDVSLAAGLRASYAGRFGWVSGGLSTGPRFNTYFQNSSVCGRDFRPEQALDLRNTTLELKWVGAFPSLRRDPAHGAARGRQ